MKQRPDEWYRQKAWIPKTIMYALMGATLIAALATSVKMTMDDAKAKKKATIENVIEGSAPEKFYNIDGQRVYLEIDGKPVEQYVRGGN